MTVTSHDFGRTPAGQAVTQFILANAHGLRASIITYGATLTSLHAPDRDGRLGEITLGFDTLDGYLAGTTYFGATVGRYANRIGGGRFTLDGATYTLAVNDPPNHLHGGIVGFDKVVWGGRPVTTPRGEGVTFTHRSPDGDEGYPGTLDVAVTYALNDANELSIDYRATTDAPTVVNLTNHTYWHLAGPERATIRDDVLRLRGAEGLAGDSSHLPTGVLEDVAGGPLDFREPKPIGAHIDQLAGGYDHCFVIDGQPGVLRAAARVVEPVTGRTLEVDTTEPGMQLYTGNYLDGALASRGARFGRHGAFCLEAQAFPDAPNRPNFPSPVLRPGETYTQTTVHRFGVVSAWRRWRSAVASPRGIG